MAVSNLNRSAKPEKSTGTGTLLTSCKYFEVYKMLEDKETKIFGTENSKGAREIIKDCIYRYNVEIKPRLGKK